MILFQEYDPDLPPELAAATGIHDVPVENASFVKSDVGQSDVMKGSGRVRPPLVCSFLNNIIFFLQKTSCYLLNRHFLSYQAQTPAFCLLLGLVAAGQ